MFSLKDYIKNNIIHKNSNIIKLESITTDNLDYIKDYEATSIYLTDCDISDMSALTELKYLNRINIQNTKTDFSIFNKFLIDDLTIYNCDLIDINFLYGIKNLKYLNLGNNKINDISVLSTLDLNELYIQGNDIKNLEPIKNLVNIKKLVIARNKLTDISHIKNLINLTRLDITYNKITDISVIKDFNKLNRFEYYETPIYNKYSLYPNLNDIKRILIKEHRTKIISQL